MCNFKLEGENVTAKKTYLYLKFLILSCKSFVKLANLNQQASINYIDEVHKMSNQQCCETLNSSTLPLDKLLRLQIKSAAERLVVTTKKALWQDTR